MVSPLFLTVWLTTRKQCPPPPPPSNFSLVDVMSLVHLKCSQIESRQEALTDSGHTQQAERGSMRHTGRAHQDVMADLDVCLYRVSKLIAEMRSNTPESTQLKTRVWQAYADLAIVVSRASNGDQAGIQQQQGSAPPPYTTTDGSGTQYH